MPLSLSLSLRFFSENPLCLLLRRGYPCTISITCRLLLCSTRCFSLTCHIRAISDCWCNVLVLCGFVSLYMSPSASSHCAPPRTISSRLAGASGAVLHCPCLASHGIPPRRVWCTTRSGLRCAICAVHYRVHRRFLDPNAPPRAAPCFGSMETLSNATANGHSAEQSERPGSSNTYADTYHAHPSSSSLLSATRADQLRYMLKSMKTPKMQVPAPTQCIGWRDAAQLRTC
jgi:hypothetical protein